MSIRNYPNVPRVYVDMDGVVADFGKEMAKRGLSSSQLKVIPGAYLSLEPIPNAIESVHKLLDLGFFVMVLTKIPSQNPYAAAEKMIWLQKHLPVLKDHIIVTPDKGCVGTPRDFLIDDFPEWANAHNFPGRILKFGSSMNLSVGDPLKMIGVPTWKAVIDFISVFSPKAYVPSGISL